MAASKKTTKKKAAKKKAAPKSQPPIRSKDPLMTRMFIENVGLGMSPYGAAKAAGCKNPQREAARYMEDPDIRTAIEAIRKENQKNSEMTRKDVMAKLIRACEIAEMQGDPQAMVRALSEVNRMCGYHAPERKIHELKGSTKEMQAQLEDLSKEELLEALDQEEETPLLEMERNEEGVFEVVGDE